MISERWEIDANEIEKSMLQKVKTGVIYLVER